MHPLLKLLAPFIFVALPIVGCVHADGTQANIAPPDSARFGSSVAVMTPEFENKCDRYEVRQLDPAELPIAQTSHVQVDCSGFSHAGKKRLAEFVFADDRLAFIWVLTTAAEEETLLKLLRAAYGEPTHDTSLFVAFADDNLALRRDIPELLYYSQTVAPVYRGWFDQSASEQ